MLSGPRRDIVFRFVTGAGLGVWLWCAVAVFWLLPGFLGSATGLLALVTAAGFISLTRLRELLRVAVAVWTGLVLVVGLTPLSRVISRKWVRDDGLVTAPIGAVVVLGGGVSDDSTVVSEGLDRLIAGVELQRRFPTASIVTTRMDREVASTGVSGDADMERLMRVFGVGQAWVTTPAGGSTRDEAVSTRDLLRPRGVRRIAVVTSPMHTRRACASFEAVGFTVVCVPSRLRTYNIRTLRHPLDRLQAFGQWVYEMLGMAKYRTKGWVYS